MTPSRWRAGLVITVIVVASALLGAAADRAYLLRTGRLRGFPPGRPTREQEAKRRHEMLERLTNELGLSRSQQAGIDSVMQRTDSSLRAIRHEMQPRLQQVFEGSREEISARLDSAQRVKFAQLKPPRRPRDSR
jgi:hypothetical protein